MATTISNARRERIELARRMAATLEGRRVETAKRREILGKSLSEARSRQSAKEQVDDFLERLQNDHHAAAIGSFGRTLTAFAKDVNPNNPEIRLRMHTERGLPGLDIEGVKNGKGIDIMEHSGGGLTNVVCVGLRAIGIVRSGLRPFLVLDEADSWINPARAPAFYRVIKQMSSRMKFQTLAISHHPVELFDGGMNVIGLSGVPDDPAFPEAVTMRVRDGATPWADDEVPGWRWIRFRNYTAFADAKADLSPGLNVFTGDIDTGKSRIPRFVRGLCYGGKDNASDDDIRNRAERAECSIGLERGRVLLWSKSRGKSPNWKLTDSHGKVVNVDGTDCNTSGVTVPEWVGVVLGIKRVEGLDLQIAHQKLPVFLLNEPASKRATVLSVGRESAYLAGMIALQKSDVKKDADALKLGDGELSDIVRSLDAMEALDGIGSELDGCVTVATGMDEAERKADVIEGFAERVSGLSLAAKKADDVVAVLSDLPDLLDLSSSRARAMAIGKAGAGIVDLMGKAVSSEKVVHALEGLPDSMPSARDSDSAALAGRRIREAAREMQSAESSVDALSELPDDMPVPVETKPLAMALGAIVKVRKDLTCSESEASTAAADCQAIAVEMAECLEEGGNLCPTCGGALHADHLLERHQPIESLAA